MVDALFVKSKVREYIKTKDCNTAGDVLDDKGSLNKSIIALIDNAIRRCKANGRKTVKARDI